MQNDSCYKQKFSCFKDIKANIMPLRKVHLWWCQLSMSVFYCCCNRLNFVTEGKRKGSSLSSTSEKTKLGLTGLTAGS
jgi:hypothetical protein